ncbi:hypothetical protein EV702DRAFT_1040200 [Suillus placidus]|uniref:Uncharacterized protein n=1 Tax=Suillus placidus TaxID=48579 RepID=A0A9P7A8R3_9AGAM|nr:hypothetical protein EV702DRAFT_1040200 [Suillus placidus]
MDAPWDHTWPDLADVPALRRANSKISVPFSKLSFSEKTMEALYSHIDTVGLDNQRFDHSAEGQRMAFKLLSSLGLHIPDEIQRDVCSKYSIHSTDRKEVKGKAKILIIFTHTVPGSINVCVVQITKLAKDPPRTNRLAGRMSHVSHGSKLCRPMTKWTRIARKCYVLTEIAGIFDHTEAWESLLQMDRDPRIGLHPEIRTYALSLVKLQVPITQLQQHCHDFAKDKFGDAPGNTHHWFFLNDHETTSLYCMYFAELAWSPAGVAEAARHLGVKPEHVPCTTNHLESFNGRIKHHYFHAYQHSGQLPHLDVWILTLILKVIPAFFQELAVKEVQTQYFLDMRHTPPKSHYDSDTSFDFKDESETSASNPDKSLVSSSAEFVEVEHFDAWVEMEWLDDMCDDGAVSEEQIEGDEEMDVEVLPLIFTGDNLNTTASDKQSLGSTNVFDDADWHETALLTDSFNSKSFEPPPLAQPVTTVSLAPSINLVNQRVTAMQTILTIKDSLVHALHHALSIYDDKDDILQHHISPSIYKQLSGAYHPPQIIICSSESLDNENKPPHIFVTKCAADFFDACLGSSIADIAVHFKAFCIAGVQGLAKSHLQEVLDLKKFTKAAAAPTKVSCMYYQNFDTYITAKLGIIIENWPLQKFCCPGDISSCSELTVLSHAWKLNPTHFCKLTDSEFNEWSNQCFQAAMDQARVERDAGMEVDGEGQENRIEGSDNKPPHNSTDHLSVSASLPYQQQTSADNEPPLNSTDRLQVSTSLPRQQQISAHTMNVVTMANGIGVNIPKKTCKQCCDKGQKCGPQMKKRSGQSEVDPAMSQGSQFPGPSTPSGIV